MPVDISLIVGIIGVILAAIPIAYIIWQRKKESDDYRENVLDRIDKLKKRSNQISIASNARGK